VNRKTIIRILIIGFVLAIVAALVLYLIPWGEYESQIEKSEVTIEEAVDSTGNAIPTLSTIKGTYSIESGEDVQAEILFHVEGLKKTKGAFEEFTIEFNVPEDYTQSQLTVNIAAKSINTNNSMRDEELLGEDFFQVDKFPEILFESSSVSQSDTGYVAHGALSLMGAAKPLDVPFKHLGSGINKNDETFEAFEGQFEFDRTAYGMEEVTSVGNVVSVNFYCELISKPEETP
jgi:polyisoprenoid-binding protein YceI